MQASLATPHHPHSGALGAAPAASAAAASGPLSHYQILRRNGAVVPFEPSKIAIALMKAFLAVHGTQGAASASVRETVDGLTQAVVRALVRSRPGGGTFHIEDVQDQVELGLMRGGHHDVARAYVLYRDRRAQERARQGQQEAPAAPQFHVLDQGRRVPLDMESLKALIVASCEGLGADVKPEPVVAETMRNLYDSVPLDEVYKAAILAARTLIEQDPDYTFVTARLLLHTIFREVLGEGVAPRDRAAAYADSFPLFVRKGVQNELLDERLLKYDLKRLGAALKPERDLQFDYLGLQTLYDRYFLHVRKSRIELPQAFFMRVAMTVVDKTGAWFTFEETRLGQGREAAKDFLRQNPEIAGTIEGKIRTKVAGGDAAVPVEGIEEAE
jgi:ribonucleoside-diphosphate reductase alpha chain